MSSRFKEKKKSWTICRALQKALHCGDIQYSSAAWQNQLFMGERSRIKAKWCFILLVHSVKCRYSLGKSQCRKEMIHFCTLWDNCEVGMSLKSAHIYPHRVPLNLVKASKDRWLYIMSPPQSPAESCLSLIPDNRGIELLVMVCRRVKHRANMNHWLGMCVTNTWKADLFWSIYTMYVVCLINQMKPVK